MIPQKPLGRYDLDISTRRPAAHVVYLHDGLRKIEIGTFPDEATANAFRAHKQRQNPAGKYTVHSV